VATDTWLLYWLEQASTSMASSIYRKAIVKRRLGGAFVLGAFVCSLFAAEVIVQLKWVNRNIFVKDYEASIPAATSNNTTAFSSINWNATVIDTVRAWIVTVFDSKLMNDTGASPEQNSSGNEENSNSRKPPPFDPDEYFLRPGRDQVRWGESTPHVVFYNVYVPPNLTRGKKVIDALLNEHIDQVLVSPLRNSTLYVNVFGKLFDYPKYFYRKGMDCRMIQNLLVGGEENTLQDLYDFCVDNPSKRVTYIHTKGSYHYHSGNQKIRRLVTKCVVSDACVLSMPLSPEYPCNICAARYEFSPHPHVNGNMWTTECSYVRKLIPPKEFEARRRNMYRYLQTTGRDIFPCLAERIVDMLDGDGNVNATESCQALALCRYAMETWLFSHPHLIPCNTLPGNLGIYRDGLEDFVPRLENVSVKHKRFYGMHKDPFFLKQGRWWEMDYHYGMVPSETNPFFDNYNRVIAAEVNCSNATGNDLRPIPG
jgi:hypothetical protein